MRDDGELRKQVHAIRIQEEDDNYGEAVTVPFVKVSKSFSIKYNKLFSFIFVLMNLYIMFYHRLYTWNVVFPTN